jgi:hypothetical protein
MGASILRRERASRGRFDALSQVRYRDPVTAGAVPARVAPARVAPVNPAPRSGFAGRCEGSWIESHSRRWRRETHRLSTPGAARKGKSMYIGIGTVVLIIIIVLVILMLRRRLYRAAAAAI